MGLTPLDRQHYFVEIDYEIFSTDILSLLLIQEGQLSVSGERNSQYWLSLRGLSLPTQNVAFDLDLHCLHSSSNILYTIAGSKMDLFKC